MKMHLNIFFIFNKNNEALYIQDFLIRDNSTSYKNNSSLKRDDSNKICIKISCVNEGR